MYDFIIVGQGLAGTLLTYFLQKNNKKVLVIDQNHLGSSSMVAAGIINPITGKNLVLSWKINDFLPTAIEIYEEIGLHLGIQTYSSKNIIRTIKSASEENNWLSRSADPQANMFVLANADLSEIQGIVKPAFSHGELTGCMQVNLSKIIGEFKQIWTANQDYLEEKFDYSQLMDLKTHYQYKTWEAKEIVFCEGHQAMNNPFFSEIPLLPAKGEVLIIKIPNVVFDKMYKDKIFITRLYDDIYWAGSGYEWNSLDELPSEAGRQSIIAELDKILAVPFEIIDHKAAIRPTMVNRKPYMHSHKNHRGMHIFNGLGTKGSSMAPLLAKQFSEYLVKNEPMTILE